MDFVRKQEVRVHIRWMIRRDMAEVLEVESLPCSIVLNTDADLLARLVGYVDSDQYMQALRNARLVEAHVKQTRHERTAARDAAQDNVRR